MREYIGRGRHLTGMEGHLQRCGEMKTCFFTETGGLGWGMNQKGLRLVLRDGDFLKDFVMGWDCA